MNTPLQKILLAVGVLALIFLLVEIFLSISATWHGNTPARITHVDAGPYHLTVSLYDDPARAGFALPFAVTTQPDMQGTVTYQISSVPAGNLNANPVKASVSPDPHIHNGIQGVAEITVRGPWMLHIAVAGPQGHATANVPVTAVALPAIPYWLGWLIGLIPVYGLLIFLIFQRNAAHKRIKLNN